MSIEPPAPPPSAHALRAAFDAAPAYTLGVEEEVMVLDPGTLELVPQAPELLERLDGDPRFKLELPASQLEIFTPPMPDVQHVEEWLRAARHALARRTAGAARLAAAGVHPSSPGEGALNGGPRYEQTVREFGAIAARQQVCALQVHVSVGHSDRALAVYNELRAYLPLIAALAANAPFYEGRDTGLASVRPKLAELLPRQGVPPPLESWEAYAEALRWGARAGSFPDARSWWWELRPHPGFGTLELRVPDAQTTVADGCAVAAVAHALVAWLGARHDAGEAPAPAASWRIEENRWSACRHGVQGSMADLATGRRRPTRQCLNELLDELGPTAGRLNAGPALEHARALVGANGALAQREAAGTGGARAAARFLAERFLA